MQRRKFLATVGSLAAGSAAAIGTGAFSKVSATRAVSVDIEPDSNSFLHLSANHESLENGEYAQGTGDGALELVFDEDAGVMGGGVNPNAVSYFDNVFQILNHGTQQVQITIDKSGLDNPDAFGFYWTYSNGTLGGGGPPEDSDENGVLDYREVRLGEGDNTSVTVGFGANIGVCIDTTQIGRSENWETGSIKINATEQSNPNGA